MKTLRALIFTIATLLALPAVAADAPWTHIVAEDGAPVPIRQAGVVRYGSGEVWVYKSYKAGETLNCNNATFGDPVVSVPKVCQSNEPGLLITPAGPAVPVAMCIPWAPGTTVTTMLLSPPGKTEWLAAGDEASGLVSTWCVTKYKMTSSNYYGFKGDLPDNPAKWATDYLRADVAGKRAMIDAQRTCKPGMNANLPPCLQYLRLAAEAQQLSETIRPKMPMWQVKPNASTCTPTIANPTLCSTRPQYPVSAAGVRGTTALKTRATVGESCACNKFAIDSGVDGYCPVGIGPTNVVTLCVAVK